MARMRLVPATMALVLIVAVVGCSSSSKSTSTSGGGGVSVTSVAPSGTVVHVTVSDTSGLNGSMTMTAAPSTVPAGDVTFIVKNSGTIDHEAVVLQLSAGQTWDKLPIADAGDPPAPVTTGANKVSEDNNIGETGDPNLKPGESRTFVIKNMKAGNYAIVCNIAQHYGMGMRAQFTVS